MEQTTNFFDLEMESLGYRIKNGIGVYRKFDENGKITEEYNTKITKAQVIAYQNWKERNKKQKTVLCMKRLGVSDGRRTKPLQV